ncbi:hypothetical protein GOP47_0016165 [Adiantum capillus-veneris]|uniref:Uncharacterized protein n=1 Tax=Adiantum capillus-veneris TaxID=13818 RepID=A0A9D4ZC95_ADICA|nr:hypothetical protein GOP47_0015876 [Adiantum capillus-veneris]KAI5069864.1 hypothetical protein GOP47_0016165 [Adiantum capillus-veneris]
MAPPGSPHPIFNRQILSEGTVLWSEGAQLACKRPKLTMWHVEQGLPDNGPPSFSLAATVKSEQAGNATEPIKYNVQTPPTLCIFNGKFRACSITGKAISA